ncbi:MAG: hypothetical protein JEZ12_03210 [Desulfobacterium sp.]|nr:hypothetical protein [Desulfobacterium sp.]
MQHDKKKSDALLSLLTQGLLAYSEKETARQLGDRSLYIGMSDIGKGMECLRSAVASKIGVGSKSMADTISALPLTEIAQILGRQIILQRGHWQETGIENALTATGVKLIPQLEISIYVNGIPIKAHLDFTIVWGGQKPAVRIIELKSNEHIPDILYASYEAQLYGQAGLLKACWNKPCFSVPDEYNGEGVTGVTFPQAIHQMFGVELPALPGGVDIEAWVLSISMSTVKPFGPYKPDQSMLTACLRIAKNIWIAKEEILAGNKKLNDLNYCYGFHPLCDWCDFNENCPKFQGKDITDLDPQCGVELNELAKLKEQRNALNKKITAAENRIRKTYHLANQTNRVTWLTADDFRFKVSTVAGRKTLDREVLAKEISAVLGDEDMAQSILKRSEKVGKPFERLFVSKINKIASAAA